MVDASLLSVLSLLKVKTVELILHTDDCDQLDGGNRSTLQQIGQQIHFPCDFYMNHEPGQQQVCCGPVLYWLRLSVKEMGQREAGGDCDALRRHFPFAGFGRK